MDRMNSQMCRHPPLTGKPTRPSCRPALGAPRRGCGPGGQPAATGRSVVASGPRLPSRSRPWRTRVRPAPWQSCESLPLQVCVCGGQVSLGPRRTAPRGMGGREARWTKPQGPRGFRFWKETREKQHGESDGAETEPRAERPARLEHSAAHRAGQVRQMDQAGEQRAGSRASRH